MCNTQGELFEPSSIASSVDAQPADQLTYYYDLNALGVDGTADCRLQRKIYTAVPSNGGAASRILCLRILRLLGAEEEEM